MFLPTQYSIGPAKPSPAARVFGLAEHRREMTRRAIVRDRRVDIMAKHVLGYIVADIHEQMADFQVQGKKGMLLAFRGAGKSIIANTSKVLTEVAADPVKSRILIVSKTLTQAQTDLKPIKWHIEHNQEFKALFGSLKSSQKWDLSAIDTNKKSQAFKEHSILCAGIDTSFVGQHFTLIIGDDLVDDKNSATMVQRDKLRRWFYEVLLPCLEAGGEIWLLGTRYHFDDLYGKLLKGEMKRHYIRIPALNKKNESTWPQMYSTEYFLSKKATTGSIIFAAQYQNEVDLMRGKIFKEEWMGPQYEVDTLPDGLQIWQAVDLAAAKTRQASKFATALIGVKERMVFVLGGDTGYYSFLMQIRRTVDWYRRYSPIRLGVEGNAYQLVFHQYMSEAKGYEDIRSVPIYTNEDKDTKAWKLSAYFEAGRVYWVKGMRKFQDMLVNLEEYDFMDALYMSIIMAFELKWKRKARSQEPGLI